MQGSFGERHGIDMGTTHGVTSGIDILEMMFFGIVPNMIGLTRGGWKHAGDGIYY